MSRPRSVRRSRSNRRAPLEAGGAVTREEVAHARSRVAELQRALEAGDAAVAAAREQLAAQRQQTEGVALAAHPAVQRAAARLREAWIARARCDITAPLAATVARRSVQPGQRVQAGTPLLSLVALDALWVDANFKEGQLGRLRLGQRATLTADVYGRDVVFNGTVVGFGAGTGAAFALLPAQNATGNWIKIVQRVPVRIALDAQDLQAHPLRLGLSMVVQVDVQTPVSAAPPPAPRAADSRLAEVLQRAEADADAEISRIVALHGGARTSAAARRR
ncbi:MAG: HlyD family efflux transporter periplasmic adaptor subunit, partial [Aquabacterium sp.]